MFSASKSGQYPGYLISRSVRLRNSASAYFNRTPASTTNRRTMTFSFWMKRGLLTYSANYLDLFTAYPGTSAIDRITFSPSSDSLRVWFNGSSSADLITTQVFRDPSAWYHIVVAIDTTQATASNRIKVYVNGSQVTSFSTSTYPSQNYDTYWNSSSYASAIGANLNGPQSYFDGYLTEINFIDGQALTPSSFGVTNAYGVWSPIKYNGTYGTNGYYLNFSDNSGATATTIGKDSSGNNNDWTPNNISVTAGSTYDSMLDVPTPWADGGNGRGNYAVLNPLANGLGNAPSNANLRLSGVSGVNSRINSSIGVSSGKWYFEATLTTAAAYTTVGIGQNNITNQYPGNDALSYAQTLEQASSINNNVQPSYGTAFGSGDVFMCAFDLDNNKLFFGRNGTWFGSSDPAAGTNPVYTLTAGTYNAIARPNPSGFGSGGVVDFNFGQRPFAYTPPSGFKALNTQNLPQPTILKGASYFDVSTWTGNGSARSITNSGSMQPDLVWVKSRTQAIAHRLVDAVRGAGNTLASNLMNAEFSDPQGVTSFNSNGFGLGTDTSYNQNGDNYVGWQWKAGGTPAVTNTSGSITSTVSANTTAGFSVVTYTGAGGTATVGHGLGAAAKFIIIKKTSATQNWFVGSGAFPSWSYALEGLNTTAAANSSATAVFNSTAPTSTVFSVGSDTNGSGATFVAYCWAEIAGFSAFGSYTGNGSSDGPFVYTGFRPRWIMVKRSDSTGDWWMFDSARDTYNNMNKRLLENSSAA